MELGLIGIISTIVSIIVFSLLFITTRYKRCPSNKVLVIYGKVGKGEASECLHGGGAFIWPLIQGYTFLSLDPFSINPKLEGGISKENIRVNIPTNFTVAISREPAILKNAAERLLGLDIKKINDLAQDAIIGQLRQVVASMGIEELNTNRDEFSKLVKQYVETELNKLGLTAINFNIIDIKDESGFLESIGLRAAEEAKQKASVDVAQQLKMGATGKAEADRDREVKVANLVADQEISKNGATFRQAAEVEKSRAESLKIQNESKAKNYEYEAELKVKQADSLKKGELAKLDAERMVMEKQKALHIAELESVELAKQEVELKKIKLIAEGKAEAVRIEARANSEKIQMEAEARAIGEKAMLDAKASGYKSLISSMGSQAAALLTIEQLPELVKAQVEAIKGIKIDKLTILEGSQGNAISGLVKDLVKTMPAIHEIAKNVGLQLPEILGKMDDPSDPI